MNIEKALVLSTSHVPEDETTDDLGFTQEMPRVATHQYGWVVFLTSEDDRPVPEWFEPIRDMAVGLDASFVVFDPDGQVDEDIPTYEW